MKKLALTLAALATVSAVASAKEVVAAPIVAVEPAVVACPEPAVIEKLVKPNFRITSARVRLVTENRSGARDLSDSGNFRLETNYAYGDNWTGYFNARRYFTSNTEDDNGYSERLYDKGDLRTYIGATRNNLSLGTIPYSVGLSLQLRRQRDYYGISVTPELAPWLGLYGVYNYVSVSTPGDNDDHYFETQATLKYAGWGLGYYYEYSQEVGGSEKNYTNNYVVLTTPTWRATDKLGLSFEGRSYIKYDSNDIFGDPVYAVGETTKSAFDVNRLYVHATYKLNPSTDLRGSFYYEFGDWQNGAKNDTKKSYMNGVDVSVVYKF